MFFPLQNTPQAWGVTVPKTRREKSQKEICEPPGVVDAEKCRGFEPAALGCPPGHGSLVEVGRLQNSMY